MILSEIIQSKVLSAPELEKRRNMWRFYNYRVAAILVSEQALDAALLQSIHLSADHADILVVAINGSQSFADLIASLHGVRAVISAVDNEDWLGRLQPDIVLEKPGVSDALAFEFETTQI